jgi:hypothetical protein
METLLKHLSEQKILEINVEEKKMVKIRVNVK